MPSRKIGFIVVLALTAVARGASSSPASAPASSPAPASSVSSGAGGAPSEPAPASAAASQAASVPAEAPPSVAAGGGAAGGSATDACAIITPAEFGGVVGATGVTTQLIPGEVSSCIWSGNGTLVGATSFMSRGASGAFAIWAASSGVEQLSGIGDGAVWDPSSATLFVLKGDRLVGITAGSGAEPESDRKSWATELAKIAAGRMS